MGYEKDGEIFINANPKKPHFRNLSDEEIERHARKEWKKQKPVFSTDPGKDVRLKNLTGPRTIEGKKRALQNLRPAKKKGKSGIPQTHGGYVQKLLNNEERQFFEERKLKYLEDFELNESSDETLLVMVVMEEVIYRRIMYYKAEYPSKSVDKPLSECQKRLVDALKALGMTRDQRQGQKVNVQHSIADLAERVARELDMDAQKTLEMNQEEEELLRKKRARKRNFSDVTDIEYEVLDDDKVSIDD